MSVKHVKGTRLATQPRRIVSGHTIYLRTHPTATTTSPHPSQDNFHPITISHPGGVSPISVSASIPSHSATEAHMTPKPFVFVGGWEASDANYASFSNYMRDWYKARLPAGTPILVTDWRQNVASQIQKAFPGQKVVADGFSFGGAKVLATVAANPQLFDSAVVLDPVNPAMADKPNSVGFKLPTNSVPITAITRTNNNLFPYSAVVSGSNVQSSRFTPFGAGLTNGGTAHSQVVLNNPGYLSKLKQLLTS